MQRGEGRVQHPPKLFFMQPARQEGNSAFDTGRLPMSSVICTPSMYHGFSLSAQHTPISQPCSDAPHWRQP
eukprot:3295846-Rhodomonas_salina.2